MRYEKGSFITVPNRKAIAGLPPYIQSVYLWLCYHANQDNTCYPSLQTLADESGVSRRGVILAVTMLQQKGIVTKSARKAGNKNLPNFYTIIVSDSEPEIGGMVNTVHHGGEYDALGVVHKVHSNSIDNKHSNNNTQDKVDFEEFWKLYPVKVQKKKAKEKWERLNREIQETILMDIPRRLEDDSWKRKFIPHPTTYLNGERWNDEIITGRPTVGAERQVDRF